MQAVALVALRRPHRPCRGAACRSRRRTGSPYKPSLKRHQSRFVIARPQRGRGNLGKAAAFLPIAFPRFSRVLQDCHVGLRPPRNDTSGGSVVHQRPPAVEFPCAGRSLSAATPHTSAFPILTIACANRQCPMGRRGRRPLQRPTGSLVLTFHFPFPAFSLFS